MGNSSRKDILFIALLVTFIVLIALFNFVMDPYYIFRDSTIIGINNVKTHKYSDKRTILFSDMKINTKGKDIAFTGNCLLSHYGSGLNNVAFFTLPMAKVYEIETVIKNLNELAPNIKTIYWGLFYDDFSNEVNEEGSDTLPEVCSKSITLQDLINLFFSWNTTKYSIETLRDSIKNNGKDIIYVYPYREIAKKTYSRQFTFDNLSIIKDIKNFAEEKNIQLIIYYSPIHISKKVHIYSKNLWESNQELKRKLAEITDFYDYSINNPYNISPLDENNFNFIDNIHPTNAYNNIIVNDLLSEEKILSTQVTKENVDVILAKDTQKLEDYIKNNPDIAEKIKNVQRDDANFRIKRLEQ